MAASENLMTIGLEITELLFCHTAFHVNAENSIGRQVWSIYMRSNQVLATK